MIKSNQGECVIDGIGGEILLELNHIFHTCLQDTPELLIAVVTAWSPVMEEQVDKLDTKLMSRLYTISSNCADNFEVEE